MNTPTPQDTRSETLRLRLRPAEVANLRELAARDDEPVSAVVRRAIRRYVEQEKGKPMATAEQIERGRMAPLDSPGAEKRKGRK